MNSDVPTPPLADSYVPNHFQYRDVTAYVNSWTTLGDVEKSQPYDWLVKDHTKELKKSWHKTNLLIGDRKGFPSGISAKTAPSVLEDGIKLSRGQTGGHGREGTHYVAKMPEESTAVPGKPLEPQIPIGA